MLYTRFIISNILEAVKDTPVLLINGARQTGKTTLVKVIAQNYHPAVYMTLDDLSVRGAAQSDPAGFLKNINTPVVIDEIQLAPELLPAIKMIVDQSREPGRFTITGSANVLTLPRISESLAGRMEIFTLYPLSRGEIRNKREDFVERIFIDPFNPRVLGKSVPEYLWDYVCYGGFPEIQKRKIRSRQEAWFRDYIKTIVQRDIRDLANINGLTQLPRLFELLASRAGGLLNFAELSRSLQIPQSNLKRYTALLEATFLLYLLPAWSGHLGKRFVKAPKIYLADSGLLAYLVGMSPERLKKHFDYRGSLLETFVLMELIKQTGRSVIRPNIFHFRSLTGVEVDFLLEDRQGQLVGIEVKASATVRPDDFKGLKWLREQTGDNFKRGIVLYTGDETIAFGDNLFAVPVQALWDGE